MYTQGFHKTPSMDKGKDHEVPLLTKALWELKDSRGDRASSLQG